MQIPYLAFFSFFLHITTALDCSVTPPFRAVTTIPKGTGLRIGRKVSILYTPDVNASAVTIRFGMQATATSSFLFQIELEKAKRKHYLAANHSLAIFVQYLIIHQECTKTFLELVVIPHCNFSKKIFFMQNNRREMHYEVISYDIVNPVVSKLRNFLVLNTKFIECRGFDLNTYGYFILHSFPVFLTNKDFVKVQANVVSRINKTSDINKIIYRISNQPITNVYNKSLPLNITIAYEESQKSNGFNLQFTPVSHMLGTSLMPSNQIYRAGKLFHFRYTFFRNASQKQRAVEVHLDRNQFWRVGNRTHDSLLLRVTPSTDDTEISWRGFSISPTHPAFKVVNHATSSVKGNLQTLEVGVIPGESCSIPMNFHVITTSVDGYHSEASTDFEFVNIHSFYQKPDPLQKHSINLRIEVDFCSPRLYNRTLPVIYWNLDGLTNWTEGAVQSRIMDASYLRLSFSTSVFLRCKMQNLSLTVEKSQVFKMTLSDILSKNLCSPHVQLSVVASSGEQLQEVTWIRRHESFYLQLNAQFPHFFSAEAVAEVEMPKHQVKIYRARFISSGAFLLFQHQWKQQLNDCSVFSEAFQAKILEKGRQLALSKISILPRFCWPIIVEFKLVSQSRNGASSSIVCRIKTNAFVNEASWGIIDSGRSVKHLVVNSQRSAVVISANINFTSCENLRVRTVMCWFRQKGVPTIFTPLTVQKQLCEEPRLYFLFLVYCVLPITTILYLLVALQKCFCFKKSK